MSNLDASFRSAKETILIIDDNPVNLGVVVGHLETQGYEVLVALGGEEALVRAEYACPDLILLDVMMPQMDGFETCRRLKANPATADIPVIFMTALGDVRDKVAAFDAGGVDYVPKPFHFEELLARISTHLALRSARQRLPLLGETGVLHDVAELLVGSRHEGLRVLRAAPDHAESATLHELLELGALIRLLQRL